MYQTFGTIDDLVQYRLAELLREADQARLADLARGPSRPLRAQIADRLVTLAEWLDGTPRQAVARAS